LFALDWSGANMKEEEKREGERKNGRLVCRRSNLLGNGGKKGENHSFPTQGEAFSVEMKKL